MAEERVIRVGDLVWWSPAAGRPPEPVAIKFIDHCAMSGVKYGVPVQEVYESDLPRCCITLANGRWKFGNEVVVLDQAEIEQVERRAA